MPGRVSTPSFAATRRSVAASSRPTSSPTAALTASTIESRFHGGVQSSVTPWCGTRVEPAAAVTASAISASVNAIMSCTSANAW